MKKKIFFQAYVLLVCILGLVAIHGCGGGGGGGGTSTNTVPSITTASLPSGVRNQPYSAPLLSATGGTLPYTWSVPPGSLPAGLSLSAAGALTGTPTVIGTFPLTFTVTDTNGLTGSKPLSILIINPSSPPIVATGALPSGVQTQPYSASLSATSGTPPYTWSVSPGTLPTGIALSAGGQLTGTPTVIGTFPLTFTVTDTNGLTGSKPLSILITPSGSPIITTSSLPDGARTEPYSAPLLSATSGTGSYTWSATGLPAGLSLSAAGALTGTPSVEGTFTPVLIVTDSLGIQAQKPLGLRIAKPLVLFVAEDSTPSGAINIFDSASVANGASAWTRQLKGTLTTLDNAVGGPPAGVSYDAARNILYIARTKGSDNGAVIAFNNANARNGNVVPDLTIRTSDNGVVLSPSDVFIDSGKDRIYIAGDINGSSGLISIADSVSTSPVFLKTINFPYGPPAAISVDTARDILYVVPNRGTGFIAFDNVSNNSVGVRTITIGSAVGLVDVKIDPATDTAYVADYDGGRVFVINNVSQKIGVQPPDRTLTGLSNPNSVFPDVANDRLFVSNRDGATSYSVRVVENMSSVNGPVSFSRQLSGFSTAAGMTGYYK